ncbi:UvrD-helicase domain-containing protein [Calditrichota bacterium LG25]
MDIKKYLDHLNQEQHAAVTSPRQPLLLIAGPGTGKTRTIIARIIYLVEEYKLPPEQILALTFSNKAADELKSRLEQTLKERAGRIFCGTFHSFCLTVLRKNHELVKLHPFFSVCDDEYQQTLIRDILNRRAIRDVQQKARAVQLAISNHRLKDKALPPFSSSVFQEYQRHLQRHHLIDYDQILLLTLELFENHKDVLDQYRFLYQAILVDEFQDTDKIQYRILKMLAEKHRNIFVVADDDQSIYSWRGANPENIRQFIQDFRIDKIHFLEKNYRSAQPIIEAAQVILKDTDRIEPEKKIQSVQELDARLSAVFFDTEFQEVDYIIKKIKHWYQEEEIDFNEIAVLYPQHRMGEKLASFFLKERIPFQMASGRNLADHPIMKRFLLYLRLIRDPSDTLILEQLMLLELGEHLFKKIQQWAKQKQISLKKALNEFAIHQYNSKAVRNKLQTFIGNLANLINLKSFFKFDQLTREIINNIQSLQTSYLKESYRLLEMVSLKKEKYLFSDRRKIWLYHSRPEICYLGCQMLEKALGISVHALDDEKVVHVSKPDLVLLLEPFKNEPVSDFDLPLYQIKGSARQGSLTVLFRWLQFQLQTIDEKIFDHYVVFDLETTGNNPHRAGIVEIAAVKVREGEIVETFETLVNPQMEIDPEAQQVHHISDKDVQNAPTIDKVLPDFLQFIGEDLLIAHNGYAFDFIILDRYIRELNLKKPRNVRYDSLIMARNLFPNEKNSIDALAYRYKLDTGTRHRALDDVKVLNLIFRILLKEARKREIFTAGEEFAEYVALGNFLENTLNAREDRALLQVGLNKLLSPFSKIRRVYAATFAKEDEQLLNDLHKITQLQNLRLKDYDSNQEFFDRIMQMSKEYSKMPVDQAISEFLAFISLMNTQDNLEAINAVSLLTLYAAKGLEFEKVIICGMEDHNIPSSYVYRDDEEDDRPMHKKLDEQKRLLYVGITRGKSEVIFTLVRNRFGRRHKSSPFLENIRPMVDIKTFI